MVLLFLCQGQNWATLDSAQVGSDLPGGDLILWCCDWLELLVKKSDLGNELLKPGRSEH